jgi:hypothetical protein
MNVQCSISSEQDRLLGFGSLVLGSWVLGLGVFVWFDKTKGVVCQNERPKAKDQIIRIKSTLDLTNY